MNTKSKNSIYYRRWNNFKKNRRGFYSLIIFTILFIITLFAELVANDKPWVIYTNKKVYFPIINTYSEKDFGGEFELAMNYRDQYARDLIKYQGGWVIWAPIKYSYDTINYESISPASPSKENILGTDDQGRDILSRVIYGFRVSILFGILLTTLSSIVGISVAALTYSKFRQRKNSARTISTRLIHLNNSIIPSNHQKFGSTKLDKIINKNKLGIPDQISINRCPNKSILVDYFI